MTYPLARSLEFLFKKVTEDRNLSFSKHLLTETPNADDKQLRPTEERLIKHYAAVNYATIEDLFLALDIDVGKNLENRILFDVFAIEQISTLRGTEFTPDVVRTLMSRVDKPKSIFLSSTAWNSVLGSNDFSSTVAPCTKYEYIMEGIMGSMTLDGTNLNVYTDAFLPSTYAKCNRTAVVLGENAGEYYTEARLINIKMKNIAVPDSVNTTNILSLFKEAELTFDVEYWMVNRCHINLLAAFDFGKPMEKQNG